MKREEIHITSHTIVLGIFTENNFEYFLRIGAMGYGEFGSGIIGGVVDTVEWAAKASEKIIFVLDGVYFPINPTESFTCAELELICKNEQLFSKTIFVKGENVISFDKNLL